MPPSASFDVIGTCFSFSAPISTISRILSPTHPHIDSTSLFFSWFYAAQRDFTYLSLCSSYVPIATVLSTTFRRACAIVDIDASTISDADVADVMAAFKSMGPREGLKDCFDGLRDAGWDVYGVTNGGSAVSLKYFHDANIELDGEHLLSCDAIKIAKPDPKVYAVAQEHLSARKVGDEEKRWFVAAHAWDLVAARRAGFKTAYLDFEEHDPVTEIFGEFDLYAKSMGELLEKLKALG
ncbi:HAD-like protein [Phaeosphaeriaceae sp. SRC1lsM3a]|nr:HAD-like protein [Stagonospora sp. SRC1lsM3a]